MNSESRLRERRNELGLTQTQLAHAAGVSRQLVVAAEAGVNSPSVDAALRVAAVLECAPQELFGSDTTSVVGLSGVKPVVRGALVVAGCDPAIRVAERLLGGEGGAGLVALDATTGTALASLDDGGDQAAVVHGPPGDIPAALPAVRRMQLARWQVGLGIAPGVRARSLADCLDRRLAIVQRPETAASQQALRRATAALGRELPSGLVTGGHLDAARAAAALGAAAITTEGAAHMLGLRFIALEPHTVEIWFAGDLEHPAVESLGQVLNSGRFRRAALRLGGYDLSGCGAWLGGAPV